MSSVSADPTVQLFKNVYGTSHDLVPDDQIVGKDVAWSEGQQVGSKFIEDVILGEEVGISLGGSGQDAFEIAPAIAGAVKQTEVVPYVSILPSILPFSTISRSQGGGEKAFLAATKFIVKNNLKSHNSFLEDFRLYGQASELMGYVSYATATYRGVAFTNGTGTLNGVAFTNGVNVAGKYILLAPGQFAAGIWVGKKGVKVKQVDANGVVVASGKLVKPYPGYGYIQVDFTPVAASSTTSHRLCFDKQEDAQEMVGMFKILNTSGTLFGIDNTKYELFQGNAVNLAATKLTLAKIQSALANAVNGGGLDGDVVALPNPRSWETLATTEAGTRVYDSSYKPSKAENGFMDLEFYSQTGKITVKAHRKVKEGQCPILKMDTWSRSGSAQLGFKVPGMDASGDLIKPLENQAGYQFKSYSDEYIFTYAPAQNIWVSGINDEAAT